MHQSKDTISKLWHLCNILRESGITYPEYVTELTYLIFLKMARETGFESGLPTGFRWENLASRSGQDQYDFYKELLKELGSEGSKIVQEIFDGSQTALSRPKHLQLLVKELDAINWYAARKEGALGDLYEGLLEKNSTESKSGAGQYFTPRAVVESIISVVQPQAGELIQDPACGTGGFLIAADRYIKLNQQTSKQDSQNSTPKQGSFTGVEIVRDTHRLALMNAMLHGIEGDISCGDALDDGGADLPPADVILTNPPFGTKRGGGLPGRSFPFPTSNKQLAFLQHIYLGLKPGGRAAVVMPELLGATAKSVCADLMDRCRLHTILRLPVGIFYAAGVKTNVLFFERGVKDVGNTREVWVYDLRTNMPAFGRRNPLKREDFKDFERVFGADFGGNSTRRDEGETGRFRKFTRNQIRERGDNLDVSWLRNDSLEANTNARDPMDLFASLLESLSAAADEVRALKNELGQL